MEQGKVRIYRPTRNAMQSGRGNMKKWVVEFENAGDRFIDPLMGWTGSSNTKHQLRLTFGSREDAIAYAERHGLEYVLSLPKEAGRHIKAYADNFAYQRRRTRPAPNLPD